MPNRRDFLKLLALTSGGLIMGGCGSSSEPGGFFGLAPNGYRFFSIMDAGSTLPDGRRLESLPGGVLVNDSGKVVFYGQTSEGMGLYELEPDIDAILSGSSRRLSGARKLLHQGDTIPNSSVAAGLGTIATNAGGNYALVVRNSEDTRTLLYLSEDSVREVAGFRTQAAGIRFGGIFGDVDLNDQNDILVVDHFTRPDLVSPQQGLFYIPGADLTRTGILHSTLDQLPEADGFLRGLGLVDLNSNGDYIAQVVGPALQNLQPLRLPSQGLLRGTIGDTFGHRLLAGPESFGVSDRATDSDYTPGSVILGARLASQADVVAHVVHKTEQEQAVFVNGVQLIEIGQPSPGGSLVRGFSAPVLSPGGSLYGLLITEDGQELVQVGSGGSQVLLTRGDPVEGRPLETIAFGLHSDQVDSSGRLVFIAEFTDESSAVVLGLPT